ncbi:MAG: glycoside hydrolase family 65 protein [Faecousia sp.]
MKKQAPIYPVESWSITETEFSEKLNYRNETTFALSNGYLGTRGTFIEGYDFDVDTGLEGNFINGFYESEHVRYGEWNYGFPTMSQSLLNLPDCKRVEVFVDGERMDLRKGKILSYARTLHMDQGIVTREVEWKSESGKQIRFRSCQLVCLNRKNLMALKLSVTPLNFSGKIELVSKLNADVENHTRKTNPLVDYGPFGRCMEPDEIWVKNHRFFYQGTTKNSKLTMACAAAHTCDGTASYTVGELNAEAAYACHAEQNSQAALTKFIAYTSSLDMPILELESFLMEILNRAQSDGFQLLLQEQKKAMDIFWQAADIQIDGDEALQQGLRFNLFHIMQAAGRDGRTGMGAKGLSGEGYEGHYFWDTEMYVLPVFIWTNPELAKQLLLYRYHTLPQARERARVLGHPIGALYPWRTINGEEASTYFPLGTAQYHINGDIAYAVWQYYEATGDYEFLRDYGAEMLIETARVFADVGCFAECRGGKYCICAVTGPDEYNAIVDNNLYTNLLAQENLYAALRALEILGEDANKLAVSGEEKALWKRVADNMYLPYDEKLGVYLQDDGFMMRKPYDENSIPEEKRHLLYENYHPLFIYRQRMCKQADAIYGLQLLSHRFTNAELLRNYEFYQTVTLHHSSLSTSIFGMLACRVGKLDDACRYFSDSARMDLDDYHENFYAGIHAANMAGTWQSIVFGFAGLRRVNGIPEFSPILPMGWKGYAFSIRYRGSLLKITVCAEGVVFTLENDEPVSFRIRDRKVTLTKKGDTYHEAV